MVHCRKSTSVPVLNKDPDIFLSYWQDHTELVSLCDK